LLLVLFFIAQEGKKGRALSSPVNTGIGDLWRVYHPYIYPGHWDHSPWPSLILVSKSDYAEK